MFCIRRFVAPVPNKCVFTRISFIGTTQTLSNQQEGATLPVKKKFQFPSTPKLKYPLWFLKQERVKYNERLTDENKAFIKEVVHDKYGPPAIISGISTYQLKSPLKTEPLVRGEWTTQTRRCGLIARKIGVYPMWDKKGNQFLTTLLQVVDNHVVKYIPPEEYKPVLRLNRYLRPNKYGCLVVGAESMDPQNYTKQYTGLFSDAGLMPKRHLGRFHVSPEAAVQPGTPLYATHFRPGDVVDVRGKTIDRGFQGVMKRWGFKGLRATHGVTKSHRRGGCIGGGSKKAGVWKGKKMPGHMGNKMRINRGLKIWRINTKYNVLYVQGPAVPGECNSLVYIYDTMLPLRKTYKKPAAFPTHYPEEDEEAFPEDIYDEEGHSLDYPTIFFEEEKK